MSPQARVQRFVTKFLCNHFKRPDNIIFSELKQTPAFLAHSRCGFLMQVHKIIENQMQDIKKLKALFLQILNLTT